MTRTPPCGVTHLAPPQRRVSATFIALAEVFAESAWRDGSRESLGELNGAYDRIITILESRLRGDDELARGGGLD